MGGPNRKAEPSVRHIALVEARKAPSHVTLRAVLVVLFGLLIAIQIVRTAIVESWGRENPTSALHFWANHPDVQKALAMAEVGAAAAELRAPPSTTLERLERLAGIAPLAVEPFLVHGAIAQRESDNDRAEQLLLAARDRDPRSTAARFLLADLYLRGGRFELGLSQLAVFSRFVPGAPAQIAPALAQYARQPGSIPQLQRVLALHPELEPALMGELATDTRNVDVIMALASSREPTVPVPGWQATLLHNLVEEGAFAAALHVWSRLSHVPASAGRGLMNPRFAEDEGPPPFNWSFSSDSEGVAEPNRKSLDVLYHGRADVVLAEQLMILSPGGYRFSTELVGETGPNISWTLTCLPIRREITVISVANGQSRRTLAGDFQISGDGCDAQRLQLKGQGEEFPRSVNFRVLAVSLEQSGLR